VLFDSWYAAWQNLKLVNSLKLTFYTTLKNNRLVSPSIEEGYVHLEAIDWTAERLTHGVIVKLEKVPFKVKLFKLVATNSDIDWIITNDLDETLTTQVVETKNNLRWKVEHSTVNLSIQMVCDFVNAAKPVRNVTILVAAIMFGCH
jgi:hypothetical protein